MTAIKLNDVGADIVERMKKAIRERVMVGECGMESEMVGDMEGERRGW